MSKVDFIKRFILCIIGIFFVALGIAFSKQANLGISTISSVPNILSLRFDFVSFGFWSASWNIIMVLGQILILKKNFKKLQLLQIPLSFVFGYFTDFGLKIASLFPTDSYLTQATLMLMGVVILAFGISLTIIANLIFNSGEGIVKAIADVSGKDFGRVKTVFDICCVATAALLSMIFFNFQILGIREGTLVAALFTGLLVNLFNKILKKTLVKELKLSNE
ncbi:MAG: YitT family protein [Ruminococcus sp.]|nr:YitT family protein [Ruminococcus sp.]